MSASHPYVTLRQQIRQAKRQFRHNQDNSPSLFYPQDGFTYGYDTEVVDAALEAFERAMGRELSNAVPEKEALIQKARQISAFYGDKQIRDFAQAVLQYFKGGNEGPIKAPPVAALEQAS